MTTRKFDTIFWKSIAFDLGLQLEKINEEIHQAHDEKTGTNFVLEGRFRVYSIITEFPTEVETEKLKQLVAGVSCQPHNLYIRAKNKVPELEAELQREDLARWRVDIRKELEDCTKYPDKLVQGQSCLSGFPTASNIKGIDVHIFRDRAYSVKRYIANTLELSRSTEL